MFDHEVDEDGPQVGQTLQRPLQESAGSVTLTLLEQEGPVAQPHRLTLTETLHHRLIQAFCLLEKHMRQGHMSASCWKTGMGSQNCSARSNTFFRLSSVPYRFSRFSSATHTFSFSCSSLQTGQ
ncbi:hypothetical protein F7725_016040, partial [Dissostichus mawsoni]